MGKSTSASSHLHLSRSASVHSNWSQSGAAQGQAEAEDSESSVLPNTASIRVISKPRESHFAAAKVQYDPCEMEVGIVMPSSSSGSLSSLGRRPALMDSSNVTLNRQPSSDSNGIVATSGEETAKRTFSSSSLYPWKKLIGSKKSSESLASMNTAQDSKASLPGHTASSAMPGELGLGLHASDSQASISSTMRKWLKGEGTSSITPAQTTDRRVTRSISSASIASGQATPAVQNGETAIRPKRKRSSDDVEHETLPESHLPALDTDMSEDNPTSPEVPQRRIKARPSRAPRRSTLHIVNEPSGDALPVSLPAFNSPSLPVNMSVEEKVVAEMRARMEKGRQNAVPATSSSVRTPTLPPSPLKSVSSRTRGRFSSQHEKQFGRMDSIANHYAAQRDHPVDVPPMATTRTRPEGVDGSVESDGAKLKRARLVSEQKADQPDLSSVREVTYAAPPVPPQRTDEERAAIRRKLDIARQRRRSSTAAGRKSISAQRHGRNVGPSAKLGNSKPSGLAQKISFAVRGFMGAARGLTASSVSSGSTAASTSTSTSTGAVRSTSVSMAPPVSPSKESLSSRRTLEKKPSTQSFAPQRAPSSPLKAPASGSTVVKKRSTFDLQASLARKPTGYTPYSARETVELLASDAHVTGATAGMPGSPVKAARKGSMLSTSLSKTSAGPTSSSSVVRSSSITFPSAKGSDTRSPVKPDERLSSASASSSPPNPSSPSVSASSRSKKIRSSASHAARKSIKSPRKSAAGMANTAQSSASAAASSARRSRRAPSLQAAGQAMASQLMSERRTRMNAMIVKAAAAAAPGSADETSLRPRRPSAAIAAARSTGNSNGPPPLPAPPAAGHGSPRKTTGAIPVTVQGRGRGKSTIVERTASQQRKSSATMRARG